MPTLADLEEARQEARKKQSVVNDLVQERTDRRQRLEEIESRAESARQRAEERELVPATGAPEGDPTRRRALAEAEKLENEIEELEQEEQEAREELEAARDRVTEIAKELAPRVAGDLGEKREAVVDAYRELGEAALEIYLDRVLPAEADADEAREELNEVLPSIKQGAEPGQERRTAKNQVRELESWVDQVTDDASAKARLGFLVREIVRWSSRASSPVPEIWERLPQEREEGSCLNRSPLPAAGETVHRMMDGDLPV